MVAEWMYRYPLVGKEAGDREPGQGEKGQGAEKGREGQSTLVGVKDSSVKGRQRQEAGGS